MKKNKGTIPCPMCKGSGGDYAELYDECVYTYWRVCLYCQGWGYVEPSSNDDLRGEIRGIPILPALR